ncbi:hypothetical protein Tco_0613532 [Tanacetum coccineum]
MNKMSQLKEILVRQVTTQLKLNVTSYFKVKGKLTDSILNEMLEFFQNVFPTAKGYKLPPSYYAIKKTFKTIRLGYESIHACVNDYFLFWGDANKDVHLCPVCNTSRWKDSNTSGKKVPKKVLRYFPIIPKLQRLYKSSHTAKEIEGLRKLRSGGLGELNHIKAILVRESREMEDGLVILDGEWMKDTNDLTKCQK